jgi:transcription initiation factor TFIIA large subunit
VYQQIIDKVIQASQNDFEEFGVDQTTLDEMKQVRDSLVGYPAIEPSLSSAMAATRSCSTLSTLFHVYFLFLELFIDRCAAMDDGTMQPGSGGDGRPKAGLSSRLVSQVGGCLEYLDHFL